MYYNPENLRDQMSANEQFEELRLTTSKLYASPSILPINDQHFHRHTIQRSIFEDNSWHQRTPAAYIISTPCPYQTAS